MMTWHDLLGSALPNEFTNIQRCGDATASMIRGGHDRFGELPIRLVDALKNLYVPRSTLNERFKSHKATRYSEVHPPSTGRPGRTRMCRMTHIERHGRIIRSYPTVPIDSDQLWFKQLLGQRGIHPVWGDQGSFDRLLVDIDTCPGFADLTPDERDSAIIAWLVVLDDLATQAGTTIEVHVLASTGGFWLQTWFSDPVQVERLRRTWNGVVNLVTWRIEAIVRGTIIADRSSGTEIITQNPDVTIISNAGCRTWASPSETTGLHSNWVCHASLGTGDGPRIVPVESGANAQMAHTLSIGHTGRMGPICDLLERELPDDMLGRRMRFSELQREILGGLPMPVREDGHRGDIGELDRATEAVIEVFGDDVRVLDDVDGGTMDGGGFPPNNITLNIANEADPLASGNRRDSLVDLAERHLPMIRPGETYDGLIESGAFGRLVAHAHHLGLVDEPGFWIEDLADAVVARLAEPTIQRCKAVDDFVACCSRQIRGGTFPFVWRPSLVDLSEDVQRTCWLMSRLFMDTHASKLKGFSAEECGYSSKSWSVVGSPRGGSATRWRAWRIGAGGWRIAPSTPPNNAWLACTASSWSVTIPKMPRTLISSCRCSNSMPRASRVDAG